MTHFWAALREGEVEKIPARSPTEPFKTDL